jgi:hypothetical protein
MVKAVPFSFDFYNLAPDNCRQPTPTFSQETCNGKERKNRKARGLGCWQSVA